MDAWRATVRGRVQGVGFRWSTVRSAEALGVAGWVRNLPTGEVEVFAQGGGEALRQFHQYLAAGPRHASVRSVVLVDEAPDPTMRGFTIR